MGPIVRLLKSTLVSSVSFFGTGMSKEHQGAAGALWGCLQVTYRWLLALKPL